MPRPLLRLIFCAAALAGGASACAAPTPYAPASIAVPVATPTAPPPALAASATVTAAPTDVQPARPTPTPVAPPGPTPIPPTGTPIPMSKPLFDFETPETLRAWFSQDDPVMGGVSRSQLAHLPAGAMLFSGTVRLENNGGFASVRGRATREHADISAFNAIALRVRGDGKSHGFTLGKASQNNVMYQARFSTRAGEWQEIVLPYREFRPSRFGNLLNLPAFDGRDVGMYGFIISDKQTGRFALEVDNVRAVGP